MKPTLLVLAAGMGSRYGGLKQIDPVGPYQQSIIDYSIYDAIRAGFAKIVFVIRQEIEADFRTYVGNKFSRYIPVDYAYQELSMVPAGFSLPPQRQKPWGTAHAVIVAAPLIKENFAVINADDFYGAASFRQLADFLRSARDEAVANYAMVGFILRNTLSEHGSVARGLCRTNGQQYLENVVELTKIEKAGAGARYTDETGRSHPFSGDEIVSMNMWGFTPSIFTNLERLFAEFLQRRGQDEKAEFYIPTGVNSLIGQRQARVKVLASVEAWFGVTYKQDKPLVEAKIRALIDQGHYPEQLWPDGDGNNAVTSLV
jgi:UTP-glucose-1-phosphate uridylyltransferase